MPRAQNARGFVNAAFLLELEEPRSLGKVVSSRLCFGGISPEFVRATAVEEVLRGQCYYSRETVGQVFRTFQKAIVPTESLLNCSVEYRRMLACSLFYKLLLEISPPDVVEESYRSGGAKLHRELSSGKHSFETNESLHPINQPVEKIEGRSSWLSSIS